MLNQVYTLRTCQFLRENDYDLYVVSHKTERTPNEAGSAPLRERSLQWIRNSPLSSYFEFGSNVFFEPTRERKIERIKELKFDAFVDDLEDILLDSNFPTTTRRILIHQIQSLDPNIICVSTFLDIKKVLD